MPPLPCLAGFLQKSYAYPIVQIFLCPFACFVILRTVSFFSIFIQNLTANRGVYTPMNVQDVVQQAHNANLRLVRFLYCDNGGIIRGKATHGSKLATRMTEGIG